MTATCVRRWGIDFVLSKFTEAEKAKLPDLLREICARIEEIG